VILWWFGRVFLQDGWGYGIYGQRYNSTGVAQGGEFRVNSYTTDSQLTPAITSLATGDFVVVWESDGQDGSPSGVYGQRYNSAGVAQGGEFQANTYTTNAQYQPAIAGLSTGDFVVVWASSNQDGNNFGVYSQRYNSTGVKQGDEFRVNSYTTSSQTSSAITSLATGGFVVVWGSYAQDGDDYGIYGQRYNSVGVVQGGEFRVNSYTTSPQTGPAITSLTTGDFVVVWSSDGQDGSSYGTYGQHYNNAGVKQSNEFRVNSYTTNSQRSPAITGLTTGDFVVVWTSDGQDGSSYGIFGKITNTWPVKLSVTFDPTNYTENAVPVSVDAGLIINDIYSPTQYLQNATVTVAAGYLNTQDVLGFTDQNGIVGTFNAANGVLSLAGNATVTDYQTALRNVTYENTSDNPSTQSRSMTFVVNDGEANSNTVSKAINVIAVNDPCMLAASSGNTLIPENTPLSIDPGITVNDPDSQIQSATITITPVTYVDDQDVLGFSNQNGISGVFNNVTGVLTLTGNASASDYQTALRSVTYENISDDPNTQLRDIEFLVNDGSVNSNTVSKAVGVVAVNDPPVILGSGGITAATENVPVEIDPNLTLSDVDNTQLQSATIAITPDTYRSNQDELYFTNQNGISGNFNTATGVLTLNGPANLASYQLALRNVFYQNIQDIPDTASRSITFTVNDGIENSNTASQSLTVTAVNDPPVINVSSGATSYTIGGSAPVLVDSKLNVDDPDSLFLQSATVSITPETYVTDQDVLDFVNQNGISGIFNMTAGVIDLIGSSSVSNYQTALRSITYKNTAKKAVLKDRIIMLTTNDGFLDSVGVTKMLSLVEPGVESSFSKKIKERLAIALPSVIGSLVFAIFAWVLTRRHIRKSWEHKEYEIANELRLRLRLSLGTAGSSLGIEFIKETNRLLNALKKKDCDLLHLMNTDRVQAISKIEEMVIALKTDSEIDIEWSKARYFYDVIPDPTCCWQPDYQYRPGMIEHHLSVLVDRVVNSKQGADYSDLYIEDNHSENHAAEIEGTENDVDKEVAKPKEEMIELGQFNDNDESNKGNNQKASAINYATLFKTCKAKEEDDHNPTKRLDDNEQNVNIVDNNI
jgi:hypothetical protein